MRKLWSVSEKKKIIRQNENNYWKIWYTNDWNVERNENVSNKSCNKHIVTNRIGAERFHKELPIWSRFPQICTTSELELQSSTTYYLLLSIQYFARMFAMQLRVCVDSVWKIYIEHDIRDVLYSCVCVCDFFSQCFGGGCDSMWGGMVNVCVCFCLLLSTCYHYRYALFSHSFAAAVANSNLCILPIYSSNIVCFVVVILIHHPMIIVIHNHHHNQSMALCACKSLH